MAEKAFVCTLFEKDYHLGLGALANSLVACRFQGVIHAGFRGPLPPWAEKMERAEKHLFSVNSNVLIKFHAVDSTIHFTNLKACFFSQVWESEKENMDIGVYADPDIVVTSPWAFFSDWAADAIALCEDVNSPQPWSHPIRKAWKKLAAVHGYRLENRLDTYVNAGFIGLPRSCRSFLDRYQVFLDLMVGTIGHASSLQSKTDDRFYNMDQDCLNMALMETSLPFSLAGKEGMGFAPGRNRMFHAIGPNKPWHRDPLLSALRGVPPGRADYAFWNNVQNPIAMYSPEVVRLMWFKLRLGSAIGRFYHRVGS